MFVAVYWRPLKIKIADENREFVRGHPPLFTGIAVKLLSNGVAAAPPLRSAVTSGLVSRLRDDLSLPIH